MMINHAKHGVLCRLAKSGGGNELVSGLLSQMKVKLCFVGHARAGKTSTLLALAGRDFDRAQPSTHGVSTCALKTELLQRHAHMRPDEPWSILVVLGAYSLM